MRSKKRVGWRVIFALDTLIGTLFIACLALFVSALLYGSPSKFLVPCLFIAVVLLVARRFGRLTGVLGTVVAAMIFAGFLFMPFGSLHVANPQARDSLNWMLLGGISLSFLFPGGRAAMRLR